MGVTMNLAEHLTTNRSVFGSQEGDLCFFGNKFESSTVYIYKNGRWDVLKEHVPLKKYYLLSKLNSFHHLRKKEPEPNYEIKWV